MELCPIVSKLSLDRRLITVNNTVHTVGWLLWFQRAGKEEKSRYLPEVRCITIR